MTGKEIVERLKKEGWTVGKIFTEPCVVATRTMAWPTIHTVKEVFTFEELAKKYKNQDENPEEEADSSEHVDLADLFESFDEPMIVEDAEP